MPWTFDVDRCPTLSDERRWSHVTREAFLAAVEPVPFMRLAELGAGTGVLMAEVLRAVGGKGTFYAVEKDDDVRDQLEDALASVPGGHRVEVSEGDDDDAPVGDGEADTVIVGFLLPELADPAAYLRVEAMRIVPPGGRLVLVGWAPEHAPTPWGAQAGDLVSSEQAAALIAEAGWEQVEEHGGAGAQYLFTAVRPA